MFSIALGLLLTRDGGGGGDASGSVPATDETTTVASTEGSRTPPLVATSTQAPTAAPDPPTATSTPEPTPTPTAAPTPELVPVTFSQAEIEVFLATLGDAGRANDFDSLMAWLHPAVFERYGQEACRTYLQTTELAFDVTVRQVLDPAPWDWLTNDGPAGQFDAAIEVEIARLVGSETRLQLMHLVPQDGELRWLTDCGDPQP